MRKLSLLTFIVCFCLLSTQASAQEHFTEGPVWRVTLVDIAPGRNMEFWQDVRRNLKPIWEEYKRQGIILDYAVHLKMTADEPGDWDVAIAIQYRNLAALDGLGARTDPITLKAYGSAEARRQANVRRTEYGRTVASFLMRQVTVRDLPR